MMNANTLLEAIPFPRPLRELLERTDLIRVLAVGFVFGLVVLIVRAFELENRAFLVVLALCCVCFPIHHLLPDKFKLPFFVAVSFTAITLTIGVINALWLVGLGSLFIVVAHLPLPFHLRVALQVLLTGVMIVYRAELLPSAVPMAIWPILGSMFIFRLMIYMYDLRKQTTSFGPFKALAYFFMVPNVNFTLLPVIDYKGMFDSYYPENRSRIEIYKKGVALLIRGCIHLILYRLVYQNVLVDPAVISDASEATQYLIGTFLLYLRISGYFHMISGILHMFGFNLPETHHLYFLASSFTDFWRRINIFWKDFMQKIFFYPVHFWLSKRTGQYATVVIATVYTFVITWFLHAYQWFWIRGEFKFSLQDILFWGALGIVVLFNMLIELKFPKKRSLKAPKRTWKSEFSLAIKTVLTFASIVFIWNVWSSPDLTELGNIFSKFAVFSWSDFLNIAAFCIALGGLAVVYGHRTRGDSGLFSFGGRDKGMDDDRRFWNETTKHAVVGLCILYVGYYPTTLPLPPSMAAIAERATSNNLNERDRRLLQRGYYEDLTDVARFNPELQTLYRDRPADWKVNDVITPTPDQFPPYRLIPSKNGTFMRQPVTTNEFGMRDLPYSPIKPTDTYRIAIAGASHTFGSGVGDQDVYEHIVEERINQRFSIDGLGRFESMNLSLGGYGPACKIARLESVVDDLDVDGMLYVAINDFDWVAIEIGVAYYNSNDAFYFQPVREIAERAGVEYGMSRSEVEIRLRDYVPELTRWYYSYLQDLAEQNGTSLWIAFIPVPEPHRPKAVREIEQQISIAEELGIKVIDIRDTYDPTSDRTTLYVAPWDKHPNPVGTRMLADRMFGELHPEIEAAVITLRSNQ